MGGGDKTSTVVTEGPTEFDIEKAKTAELMNSFLMSNIQSGMSGQTFGLNAASTQNMLQQLREQAARYGVSPATPQFQQIQQQVGEGLTMPDVDMLNLAMNLYGVAQPASGQPDTVKQDYDPTGNWPAIWKGLFTA